MKVIIAGSRDLTLDICTLADIVLKTKWPIKEVVSGNARGIDSLGKEYARWNGLKLSIFLADWEKEFKRAGVLRNIKMGDYADALVAIWDGKSKGTKHMIDYMESLGKPTFVYKVEN